MDYLEAISNRMSGGAIAILLFTLMLTIVLILGMLENIIVAFIKSIKETIVQRNNAKYGITVRNITNIIKDSEIPKYGIGKEDNDNVRGARPPVEESR